MICGRLSGLVSILAASLCLLPDVARASTRGYEAVGNPLSGLLILLGLLFAFALFCYACLLLDRLEQRRADRMKEDNDIDGLIRALRSSWPGTKAARSPGATGDPRAIEPLSEAMNDRYAGVRDCARRALESIKKRTGQSSGIAWMRRRPQALLIA